MHARVSVVVSIEKNKEAQEVAARRSIWIVSDDIHGSHWEN
jgi:DNA-binding transcriptional MocR family regulator